MPAGAPLHVAHAVLSLDVGGLERLVVGLARAGRARGYRVTVVCVERPGDLAAEAGRAGAEVVSLGKPPGRHPGAVEAAAGVLAAGRPDVVHAHQVGATWYVGQAARRAGVPVVHTEHGNQFAREAGWVSWAKARLFFRRAAGLADRFCCVSDEIAAAVTRWRTVPRGKVEVVPNGVPVPDLSELPTAEGRQSLGLPADAVVVGTVGRLAEVKRQDLLVRAFAELAGRNPAAVLVLVGDGPERGRLERLAGDLGVAGRVVFAGYQPEPERYLRAMDVFTLSSRSEGLPVSLLEAWAAGRPVVATAVGGIPKAVTDGADGLLVPPGEVGPLAAALERVTRDRGLAAALGAAGRETCRARYSLDRTADAYEARYRAVMTGGGG